MGEGGAYHIPLGLRLRGPLDRAALRGALDGLVARHEALRTTFATVDGEPVQRIAPASGFAFTERDLIGASETVIMALAEEEANAAFDLEVGPLIRGQLIRLGDEEHVLLITMHHIISDGWSMGVFVRDLTALYGRKELPELAIQYADYAAWQRQWLSGDVLHEQSEYWKQALSDAPMLLELPTDRPRPERRDLGGARVDVAFDPDLTAGIQALSRRHGSTTFMTVLSAWGALMARLSGQEEVVVGTAVANRGRTEIEGLIGFFVNTLALRLDVSGSPTVSELLDRVKTHALEAQHRQDLPFEQVVELINPPRSLGHSPLFQVMFAWQNNEITGLHFPGLTLSEVGTCDPMTKYDLTVNLNEVGGCIRGSVEYATALFDQATIERHVCYLQNLLAAMVADDTQLVGSIPLLSAAERERIVIDWNATERPYRSDVCIHELFEEQVERTPDAVAVVYEDVQLTYAELNVRANRLAHHLRGLGVGPDLRVALCLERSMDLVVSLLAVLKAGGAYVPLDPSYPMDRLTYMVEDSAPSVVLTHGLVVPTVQAVLDRGAAPVVNLDDASAWEAQSVENPVRAALTPQHLAFMIYTSGSTGQPKGVMVEHASCVNRICAQAGFMDLSDDATFALKSSTSFADSFFEVVVPLCHSKRVVVFPSSVAKDVQLLASGLSSLGVSHLVTVPSLANALATFSSDLPHLRYWTLSGEALTSALAERLRRSFPRCNFINLYGSTELTADSLCYLLEDGEGISSVPIGRPIANTRIYIVDAHLEPVPIGVAGELYVGGAGVARGYWNRPELTAERFIASPFVAGDRLYKTGDVARYLPDGTVEYLGRTDFQVKIRGFRIELGEIESRLVSHGAIRDAVVLAREDVPGEKRLVAYYTLSHGAIEVEQLRVHLQSALPEYMIPAAYVELEALPLTPSGKLDRKALPAPDDSAYARRTYEAPQGHVEQTLAQIWSEVLGVERVGRHDNFFELGGHSLLVVRAIARMRAAGLHADVRTLFTASTLVELAGAVGSEPQRRYQFRRMQLLRERKRSRRRCCRWWR